MARVLVALLLVLSSSFAGARKPRHSAPRPPTPTFDADVVNNPATVDRIGPKDSGSAVLRVQILLDRAHAATWTALDADTQPALIPYTILATDVAGPFHKIPTDMMEEAKLPALGYTSPLEELGERFHASPKLLQDLNPGEQLDSAGEQIPVLCLEVFDARNQLMARCPATMGSDRDPLPSGDWKVSKPLWNPVFHYNSDLFWDADEKNAKATIKPGPNNPVGVVWIGLSKEHYGIHGTPEPSAVGRTQSHGCIRLTNWDATEPASIVKPGMIASLREN